MIIEILVKFPTHTHLACTHRERKKRLFNIYASPTFTKTLNLRVKDLKNMFKSKNKAKFKKQTFLPLVLGESVGVHFKNPLIQSNGLKTGLVCHKLMR